MTTVHDRLQLPVWRAYVRRVGDDAVRRELDRQSRGCAPAYGAPQATEGELRRRRLAQDVLRAQRAQRRDRDSARLERRIIQVRTARLGWRVEREVCILPSRRVVERRYSWGAWDLVSPDGYHYHAPTAGAQWRTELRRIVRRMRIERAVAYGPREGARTEEGMLLGVRMWRWAPAPAAAHPRHVGLHSPMQHTWWPGPAMTAVGEVHGDPRLRGKAGLHACWPLLRPRPGAWPHEIAQAAGAPSFRVVVGEVAGWGDSVTGDLGWRAQHQLILRLWATASIRDAVAAAYPEVPVEVMP